jgi:hypothetical protein
MRHPPTHQAIHQKKTGRHRQRTPTTRQKLQRTWSRISNVKSIGVSQIALVAGVLVCLALGAMSSSSAGPLTTGDETSTAHTAATREAADRSSRSSQRSPVAASSAPPADLSTKAADAAADRAAAAATASQRSAPATQKATAPAVAATIAPAPAATPAMPVPVAGLTQTQMNNAAAIVAAGKSMGLPKRAYVIAVATALQESNLLNLASTALPESFSYPNEGTGSDHDSVGLFQQRPSAGWGTVAQLMTPDYAAKAFYQVLVQIPGWDTMALTVAAQSVQLSAYPDAYASHEATAQTIVDALT